MRARFPPRPIPAGAATRHRRALAVPTQIQPHRGARMKLADLKNSGHWPTLLSSFLYFDVSFMVWTILGALGAQIGKTLALTPQEKGVMVATPILAGACLRIVLGLAVDRFGG